MNTTTAMDSLDGFATFLSSQDEATQWWAIRMAVMAVVMTMFVLRNHRNNAIVKKLYWPSVPGSIPIAGHFLYVKRRENICHKLEQWADEYGTKKGGYSIKLGRKSFLVLSREDLVLETMKKRPFTVQRPYNQREAAYSVGAKGVLVAEEHQWIQENRVIRPTLNRANVQDYLGIFKEQADRLMAKWEHDISIQNSSSSSSSGNNTSNKNSGEISINDDIINLAADAVIKVGMDREFDFLHNPDKGMAKDVMLIQEAAMFRTFRPIWYWRIPYIGQYLDGYGYAVDRVSTTINQVVDEYESSNANTSGSNHDSSISRTTFLGKLFAAMESEKIKLDRERVVGNMLTLFVTGADPVSKTFLDALWHLSRDVALQDELAAEAATVDLASASLMELYDKVPRIKSFLHEIHRFYGVPLLLMQAQENIMVGGQLIPAGQNLFLLLRYVTFKCQSVPVGPGGESAAEFCPTRWLCEGKNKEDERVPHFSCPMPDLSTMSFLGFGHGMRSCPGRAYAEAFQYCMLIRLLQTFSFTLSANRPPVHISFDVVMGPDKDIHVNLTKRTSS